MGQIQSRIDAELGRLAILAEESERAKHQACLRAALLPRARELAGEALAKRETPPVNAPYGSKPLKKPDPLKSPSFLRTGERLAKAAAVPRNSPCPCGSGRKFKACCGD